VTAGKEVTPNDVKATERLRQYWAHGAGAARIAWGTPGDFDRCVVELGKHIKDPEGYCAKMHHDVLGYWPATHAAMDRGKLRKTLRSGASFSR
jgi:hypothetical protein